MKRLFDFVFSPSAIEPNVVWYSVRCGKSRRDRQARSYIEALSASSNNYLFAEHCKALADFREKVAASLCRQDAGESASPLAVLRQCTVEVVALASFLRKYPASFLNSPYTACTFADISRQRFLQNSSPLTDKEKKPKFS